MFTRVLSRPFFRRGQSAEPVPPPEGGEEPRVRQVSSESVRFRKRLSGASAKDEKGTGPRSSLDAERNDENRWTIFQPFRDPSKRGPLVLEEPTAQTTNDGSSKRVESGSFIMVGSAHNAAKPADDDDDEDEDYGTPMAGSTMDGPYTFSQPLGEDAHASGAHSGAVDSPSLPQHPFAAGVHPSHSGVLSDITETEEPSLCPESSGLLQADAAPGLSFSPFGSPYPSMPRFDDITITSPVRRVRCACGAQKPRSEEVVLRVVPPASTPKKDRKVEATLLDTSVLNISVKISNETQPVQITVSTQPAEPEAHEVASTQAPVIEEACIKPITIFTSCPETAQSKSPVVAASLDIPQHPAPSHSAMSPPTHTSGPPSSCIPAVLPPPAPAQEPEPVTVVQPSPSPSLFDLALQKRAGAPHTAERPNWAMAPEEPSSESTTPRQSKVCARGKGRSQKPSTAQPVPLAPSTAQDKAEEHPVEATSAVKPVLKEPEQGPEQWLERVNVWMKQAIVPVAEKKVVPDVSPDPAVSSGVSGAMPAVPAGPTVPVPVAPALVSAAPVVSAAVPVEASAPTSTPTDVHPKTEGRLRSQSTASTKGLNPYAPAWEPRMRARTQTMTDILSAPSQVSSRATSPKLGPSSPSFDSEIERLREMLRKCGLQEKRPNPKTPTRKPSARPAAKASPSTAQENPPALDSDSEKPAPPTNSEIKPAPPANSEIKPAPTTTEEKPQGPQDPPSSTSEKQQPALSKKPSGYLDSQGRLHREPERPTVIYASPKTVEVQRPLRSNLQRHSTWAHHPSPPQAFPQPTLSGFFKAPNGGPWVAAYPVPLRPSSSHPVAAPYAGPAQFATPPRPTAVGPTPFSPSPVVPGAYNVGVSVGDRPARPTPPRVASFCIPRPDRTRQPTEAWRSYSSGTN